MLLLGVSEALPPNQGISRLSKHVQPLVKTLNKVVREVGPAQTYLVSEVLEFMVLLEKREEELGDLGEIKRFDVDFVDICLQSEGFGTTEKKYLSDEVIQAVFTLTKRPKGIFMEIFDEFLEDRVEKWHNFDENVFFYLVENLYRGRQKSV